MQKDYDILIIGAGHNGLTAAAFLAKAGKNVLVLERRTQVGGACAPEAQPQGALLMGGSLRPDIVRDLGLSRYGYALETPAKTALISALPDSRRLVLSGDVLQTAEALSAFSRVDAGRWAEFVKFMDRAASFLDQAYKTPMPRLPNIPVEEGLPLAVLGLKLRGMGAQDMYRIIRMLPMTVREFLDEWFESDVIKALIATLGIHNANLGVMSAGSAYNLLHQYTIRGGWGQPFSGSAQIPSSLAAAAQASGAEIRTESVVKTILVKDGKTTGVVLENGEEISASVVISAVDPKRTLLSMVAPENLDPELVWKLQNIKMRGITAKVFIEMDGDLVLPGTLAIAPALDYLERAYDAAKYGQISEHPYLEVTAMGNVLSVHMQYAPYFLKGRAWDESTRSQLEKLVMDSLNPHIPGLQSRAKFQSSITPMDLENTYALTEGDLYHGQLMLDQFFFMRPLPGWSQHKTPIAGLYLGGSGVHGGGGVSGIAGRNAARQVLKG
jgi:phytoene dehydrogenase-like protein